jgi:hypothetical protein
LSDSFLEAYCLEVSKIFGGFAPEESIYLLSFSDSLLGANFLEILMFFGGFAP